MEPEYSAVTARAVNLNFPDDEFINSFIVYELFLSYNEVHEAGLVIDEIQER